MQTSSTSWTTRQHHDNLGEVLRSYWQLTKPRIIPLLLIETAMRTGTADGIILVVFVITVAAAEVAVGLGLILNLYRLKGSVEINTFRTLQG